VVTILRPQAPNIGSSRVERTEEGRILSHSYSGVTRFHIHGAGPGKSPLLDLSGAGIPVVSLTIGGWMVYLVMLTLSCAVVFKGLYHLRFLFTGFAHGDIFSAGSIRQIKGIGYSLLLWALVQFLQPFAALVIYHMIELPAGVNQVVNFIVPLTSFIAGLLVWVIALAFEEGRQLQEDSVLTV
jgi:hypothetical protein